MWQHFEIGPACVVGMIVYMPYFSMHVARNWMKDLVVMWRYCSMVLIRYLRTRRVVSVPNCARSSATTLPMRRDCALTYALAKPTSGTSA